MHLEYRRDRQLGGERDRGDSRRGGERAVVVRIGAAGRVTPVNALAVRVLELDVGGAVAGRDSPDGRAVILAAQRIGDRVGLLRIDRPAAVLEVVEPAAAHVVVLDLAKIHPHVRVLVSEQRREAQVLLAKDLAPALVVSARPFRPGLLPDGEGRRTQRQQIDQHGFVVAAPVVLEESVFGRPAVADRRYIRLRPAPIHAAIDLFGEVADLRLFALRPAEVRLAEKHAGQKKRGIYGGQLAVLEPLSGLHVEVVVEEALVAGDSAGRRALRRVVEEEQRCQYALLRRLPRYVTRLDADGIHGQADADRRDARERRCRIPVRNQAVLRVRGVPEEAEGAFLELDQEGDERGAGVGENRANDPAPRTVAVAHHDGAHHDHAQQHGQQTKMPTLRTHHHPQIDTRCARNTACRRPREQRLLYIKGTNGAGESRDTCRPRTPAPADPSAGTRT